MPNTIEMTRRKLYNLAVLAGVAALMSLGACTCDTGKPPAAPTASDAQGDVAYCFELGRLALRYTGHAGGNGGLAPDYATLDAIANCRKGNTTAGIRALEQTLRCNGFTLPKR